MSGTIVLSTNMTHTNGYLSAPIQAESTTITQTEQAVFTDTQTIPPTPTPLTIGSIPALGGIAWFKNLDTVNFVDIGSWVGATFYPYQRILAGERYPVRITPGITLYALANGADIKLQKTIYGA